MSLNNFEIISKIGEGSFAQVFKVKRLADSKYYALKQIRITDLSSKEKLNALNEIRILASINHPNIIGYKEAFFDDNSRTLCIIMEYADGGDLHTKIKNHILCNTSFPESQIWTIFIQLIRGLKALHDNKILHRDLKSANIFMCSDGTVKIGDMNIAKISKNGFANTMVGTPFYASPEIWQYQTYNLKSDMWSLGCIIYEMITLHPPFIASDIKSLYKKISLGNYKRLPTQYSTDLNNIVRQLLSIKPEFRPSCSRLLNMHEVLKNAELKEDSSSICLLKTIRIKDSFTMSGVGNFPPSNYKTEISNSARKTPRITVTLSPKKEIKMPKRTIRRSITQKQPLPPLEKKLEIIRFRILSIQRTMK